MRLKSLCLALSILLFFTVSGQNKTEPLVATRINSSIKLDGKLDEDAWQQAVKVSGFLQVRPKPGDQPSEKTSARFLYDNNYLYAGIEALDQEGGKIMANNLIRDQWNANDDGIAFILDTYNDKSNALLFYTNALGARMDEEVIGNDGNLNSSWNTFWDVSTSRNDRGYIAEFRIPFSSLRFENKDSLVMSFRIVRQIARKAEFDVFPASELNIPNIIWRVNTSSEIVFKDLKAKKPVYLSPYLNLNYNETSSYDITSNKYLKTKELFHRNHFLNSKTPDKIASNIGGDLKLGLSKNLTLDLTVNTDFAQAEVDNRVFNITRFSINLPEKRAFFLESSNYLSYGLPTGDILFNSRNIGIVNGKIVPIISGLRVTGKLSGVQLGLLNMQTMGLKAEHIDAENFTVFRFRKELYKNGSFIGGIFTNRSSTSSKNISNQELGIDFYRRVGNNWSWGWNIAGTKDLHKTFSNDNMVYNAFVFKDVDHGWAHYISLSRSGKDFNPASGFIYDRGYTDLNIANSYAWYFKHANKANSIGFILSHDIKWRNVSGSYYESGVHYMEWKLRNKNGSGVFWLLGISRDSLPYDWKFTPAIKIPAAIYNMKSAWIHFETGSTKKFTHTEECEWAGFYGGVKIQLDERMTWNMNSHFRFGFNYSFVHIDFPGKFFVSPAPAYSSHLFIASIGYSYSIKLSARALLQYDNLSKTAGANIRVRFNPQEGTDLFIVYSPVYNTALTRLNPHLPEIDNQSLIIKFTKTLNLAH